MAPTNFICMSVSPTFMAYISLTMGRIVIKLGENVGTSVQLIVIQFHKNRFSVDVITSMTLFLLLH